jgi:biotin operon repressor
MDNKEKVLEAFKTSSEMLDANGVAKITGLEKIEVSKLITKLKKEGVLVSPKRCFYEIVK